MSKIISAISEAISEVGEHLKDLNLPDWFSKLTLGVFLAVIVILIFFGILCWLIPYIPPENPDDQFYIIMIIGCGYFLALVFILDVIWPYLLSCNRDLLAILLLIIIVALIFIRIIYPNFIRIRAYDLLNIFEHVNRHRNIYIGVEITLAAVKIFPDLALIIGGFLIVSYTILNTIALWIRLRSGRRPERRIVIGSVVLLPVWCLAIYIGWFTFYIFCIDLALYLTIGIIYIVGQTWNLQQVTGQGVWYCLRLALTNNPEFLVQFCRDMRLAQRRERLRQRAQRREERIRQRFA